MADFSSSRWCSENACRFGSLRCQTLSNTPVARRVRPADQARCSRRSTRPTALWCRNSRRSAR